MPCRPTDYLTLPLPSHKGHSEPLWPQFSSVSSKSRALTGAALPLFHKQLRHRLHPDHQTPRHSSARARSARAGCSHFLAQELCTSLSQPPQESTPHRQRLGVHPTDSGPARLPEPESTGTSRQVLQSSSKPDAHSSYHPGNPPPLHCRCQASCRALSNPPEPPGNRCRNYIELLTEILLLPHSGCDPEQVSSPLSASVSL